MLLIPKAVFSDYVVHIGQRGVAAAYFTEYKKWLRYYLDFCDKYPVPDSKSERVRLFTEKLREKKQSEKQRERAAHAVSLYFEMQRKEGVTSSQIVPRSSGEGKAGRGIEADISKGYDVSSLGVGEEATHYQTISQPPHIPAYRRTSNYSETGYVIKTDSPEWDEVVAKLAGEIKVRHYSRKTLKTYANWSRQFQRFLKNKPPQELSTNDVREYLTYLAVTTCRLPPQPRTRHYT
jgi:site-specific recombinase XerD